MELLQCRWRGSDLQLLCALLDTLLLRFAAPQGAGFCFTADDHEALLHRSRSFADESTPAGNAVAAAVLSKAGCLLGEPRYLQAAQRTLAAGWDAMREHPQAHAALINALQTHLAPPQILIVRGAAPLAADWLRQLAPLFAPDRLMFAIPTDAAALPAALAAKTARGAVCAYLCTGTVCGEPVEDLTALIASLRQSAA